MWIVPALFATLATDSATPVPQASPTPAASGVRRDPCGGPQELLKKYLAASPCVFVAGQASVETTYATTKIPADVVLDLGASTGPARANRWAIAYPGALINVGISQNAQITILPPSFSQLTSATQGTLAAGATDMEFWYKQLVYVDRARGILGGILVTYEAPTGSPGVAAPGPAYAINPLLNIATNRTRTMGVSLAFPVSNFASASSSGITRAWSFAPQAVPFWRSPGGSLLALVVSHDFTTHATPVLLNTAQLVARHFQLEATYGGVNSVVDLANPLAGVTRAQGTSYSRTLTIGASYMFGTSEL